MSWFSKLFGRAPAAQPISVMPKDWETFFDRLAFYVAHQAGQNNRAKPSVRDQIRNGLACNEVPNASGEFGKAITNPIPVNGPLGELIYLSGLAHETGQRILFHRLGSTGGIDIYETVTLDGDVWDIFYLDYYHPRRSKQAPAGYAFSDAKEAMLLAGINGYYDLFPTDFDLFVHQMQSEAFGLAMCPLEIRRAVAQTRFVRPPAHLERLAVACETIEARVTLAPRVSLAPHDTPLGSSDVTPVDRSEFTRPPIPPSPSSERPPGYTDEQWPAVLGETTIVELVVDQETIAYVLECKPAKEIGNTIDQLDKLAQALIDLKVEAGYPAPPIDPDNPDRPIVAYAQSLGDMRSEDLDSHLYATQQIILGNKAPPTLLNAAQAMVVVIIAELIRQKGSYLGIDSMSGHERAMRLLMYLQHCALEHGRRES